MISVSKLTDNGAEALFSGGKAEVRKDGEVVMEAEKYDGLYIVKQQLRYQVRKYSVQIKTNYNGKVVILTCGTDVWDMLVRK